MNGLRAAEAELLAPGDPAPVTVVNGVGAAPVILVCDHASNLVPTGLDRLGLSSRDLGRHIAFDIGAAHVARQMAARLDAPAVLSGFSRLVIDCNRVLHHPSSILAVSDGVAVPGNAGVDAAAARRRAEACFWPYHRRISELIEVIRGRGETPAIISIHSFTPVLGGVPRPWEIGVLFDQDERIAVPLIAALEARGDLVVGENEPYSGRARFGYSIEVHADAAGLPGVLIEVREDLVSSPDDTKRMGDLLADTLTPILTGLELGEGWP